MTLLIAILSLVVALGLYTIPIALTAALIRGGLRGRRDRAEKKSEIETFD
ncbi:MAG: hypothetical protein ACKOOL_08795 [Novosphingobium sp.]